LFWKNNFKNLGYESDARAANYEIIKLRRDYFMSPLSTRWVATAILGLPSAFGTRPYRPLLISLIVICIFGFLYFLRDPFELEDPDEAGKPKAPLWTFSLLYSVDTFIPFVTVSNIKEWGWKIADDWRWWELLEQILGFFLFSAAAYSLGSYIL
jgi:hypothetical protein